MKKTRLGHMRSGLVLLRRADLHNSPTVHKCAPRTRHHRQRRGLGLRHPSCQPQLRPLDAHATPLPDRLYSSPVWFATRGADPDPPTRNQVRIPLAGQIDAPLLRRKDLCPHWKTSSSHWKDELLQGRRISVWVPIVSSAVGVRMEKHSQPQRRQHNISARHTDFQPFSFCFSVVLDFTAKEKLSPPRPSPQEPPRSHWAPTSPLPRTPRRARNRLLWKQHNRNNRHLLYTLAQCLAARHTTAGRPKVGPRPKASKNTLIATPPDCWTDPTSAKSS